MAIAWRSPAGAVLRGPARPDLIRDELLCEIFAATVARHPAAVAMITPEGNLTYAEVDAKAEALARGLLQKGVRPAGLSASWMPRGHELLIAQIAIAKTGAAWLPFDADAPAERIAICLADAEARGIVTTADFAGKLAAPCPAWTYAGLLAESAGSAGPRESRRPRAWRPPGGPGLSHLHVGLDGHAQGNRDYRGAIFAIICAPPMKSMGSQASDVVFQGASVAFDLSMEEIWLPYLAGATLFVATAEMMGEADKLPGLLEANRVTVLDTVPTLLSLLPRDVASLRLIILGGEACPPAIASRWCRPSRKIFNSYGPTETTVVATVAEVRPGLPVTIGRPIPNYTCYVAGEHLDLLPPGIEGELAHRRAWGRQRLFAPRPADP